MSTFSDSNGCLSVAPSGTGEDRPATLQASLENQRLKAGTLWCGYVWMNIVYRLKLFYLLWVCTTSGHSLVPEILVSVAFRSVGAATTLERTGLLSPVLRCGCRGGQGRLPITAREAQGLWGCFIAILQVVFTSDEISNCTDYSIQDWMIVCSVVSFCAGAWFLRTRNTRTLPRYCS